MATKVQILLTRTFEASAGLAEIEDEINRLVSKVEEEVLSVQVDDLGNSFRLFVTTK
jgi:hypothetical protein